VISSKGEGHICLHVEQLTIYCDLFTSIIGALFGFGREFTLGPLFIGLRIPNQ